MLKSLLCVLMLFSCSTLAKVIQVFPGHNTLGPAVESANDGDTIVLLDGVYTSDQDIELGNSKVLRAIDSTVEPIIYNFAITTGNDVSIYGITFKGRSRSNTYIDATGDIRIFNNKFDLYALVLRGKSHVVGNRFDRPQLSYGSYPLNGGANCSNYDCNTYIYSWDSEFVIAGNEFNVEKRNINLLSRSNAGLLFFYQGNGHIIGNTFNDAISGSFDSHRSILHSSRYRTNSEYVILGNRFSVTFNDDVNYTAGASYSLISMGGKHLTITNNLFSYAFNSQNSGDTSILDNFDLIKIQSNYTVTNNVLTGSAQTPSLAENTSAINVVSGFGQIANNIIQSVNGKVFKGDEDVINFKYNLCFGLPNLALCHTKPNNLVGDAKFIDTIDFALLADSPAVNSGHKRVQYNDIDGTRNNIGLHGGPWGFSQYDSQRNAVAKPYIYPLLNQIAVKKAGKANIQVVTYPRFN